MLVIKLLEIFQKYIKTSRSTPTNKTLNENVKVHNMYVKKII